ncbi:hypothetical protein ADJ73_07155 [Arsenicicoccus sp. oral taxon 190]|nr:hypothetical protein ADJ73_07155 [Arsenicicoccus sp. oral taxon 190]
MTHVLSLPSEGVASHVAASLREDGFDPVEVRRTGEAWGVRIADPRLPDDRAAPAVTALSERFEALAREHEGRYTTEGGPDLDS